MGRPRWLRCVVAVFGVFESSFRNQKALYLPASCAAAPFLRVLVCEMGLAGGVVLEDKAVCVDAAARRRAPRAYMVSVVPRSEPGAADSVLESVTPGWVAGSSASGHGPLWTSGSTQSPFFCL